MPEEPMTPQKKGPSPTEALLFYSIVKNMKNKADVDWDTVAAESGFKNAGVAKVRYGQIKKKLGLEGDSPSKSNDEASPKTTSKVTKSRGTGGSGRGRAGRGGGGGRGRGKGKTVKEENDLDDDLGAPLTLDSKTLVKEETTTEDDDDDGAVFGCINAAS